MTGVTTGATTEAIEAVRWYETIRLGDGVTLIHEPWIKPFFRCNIWHVRRRDRDLLFDSGLGHFSLRRHVPLVGERKLACVASHTHFDHIGCHHEFPDRCVHRAEAAILADDIPWPIARKVDLMLEAAAVNAQIAAAEAQIASANALTAGLDLLLEIRQGGTSILLIEHDMGVVMRISDRVVVLDHGKLIADGTPEQVRAEPRVIAAYLGEGEEE